jgi:hypothetical protein
MTKRTATKLFAVVALATATPAAAGPEHAHHREPAGADEAAARQRGTAAALVQTGETVRASVLTLFGVTVPRTLKTGAPACGNVQGKGPRRVCSWESE